MKIMELWIDGMMGLKKKNNLHGLIYPLFQYSIWIAQICSNKSHMNSITCKILERFHVY